MTTIATTTMPSPETLPLPQLEWERFSLPNGLTVIVHEDRREPRVYVGMNYRVGSKDEPPGRTGFAHLFEHLMFGGSENLPGPYMERLLQAGALEVNGSTSHDTTQYYQLVPSGMLEFSLFAEADRMGHFATHLPQEVLDQQRDIVLMEKREREGAPLGRLVDCVSRGLFPAGHPYRHTVLGEEADLLSATLADARDWSATYYTPSNAVLVLVGDIGVIEARTLVSRHFAHIPPGPPLLRPGRWVERRSALRRDRLEVRPSDDGLLLMAWNAPDACDPQSGLVSMVASLLAEGHPSYLTQALVEGGGPVRAVSASAGAEMVCGQFSVTLTLAPGADPGEAEQRLRAAMRSFLSKPIDAGQFDRLRRQELQGLAHAGESLAGKASLLTTGELLFGDPGALRQAAERLIAAHPSDVQTAAAEWLVCEPYVLQVLPFGSLQATGPSVPRDKPPVVVSTMRAARALVHERLMLASGMPMLHAAGPDDSRLVARLVWGRGLADLDEAERPLALMATGLPRFGLGMRDAPGLAAWLAANDLQMHCSADAGACSVEVAGPASASTEVAQLLADIVLWSTADGGCTSEAFEREKDEVLAHLAAEGDSPLAHAQALPAALLLGTAHPLQHSPRAQHTALEKATLDDVRRVHRRLFDPTTATLIMVGSPTPEALGRELEARWGVGSAALWSADAAALLTRVLPAPAETPSGIRVIEAGSSAQVLLAGACLLPAFDPADEWAIRALNHLLGGSANSRLNQRLREELRWTYGVRTAIVDSGRPGAPCLLTIQAAVDPAHAAACLQEVQATLDALAGLSGLSGRGAPTAEELDDFRRGTSQRLPSFAREPGELVRALNFQHRWSLAGSHWTERAQALEMLPLAAVQAKARELLLPARFRWTLAGDAAALLKQLTQQGMPADIDEFEPRSAPPVEQPMTIDTPA